MVFKIFKYLNDMIFNFELSAQLLWNYFLIQKIFPMPLCRRSEAANLIMKTLQEISYRKQHRTCKFTRIFSCMQWGLDSGGNQPMAEREARTKIIYDAAYGPIFKISKTSHWRKLNLCIYFSLWPGILKILKPATHGHKVPVLIHF